MKPRRLLSVLAGVGWIATALTAHAQATFIWTNGSDVRQDGSAWTTNGGATGAVLPALGPGFVAS
jgi:hypothetical protein